MVYFQGRFVSQQKSQFHPVESGHLLPPQLGAPGRTDGRDFRESRWVPPPPPREASPSRGVLEFLSVLQKVCAEKEAIEGIQIKFGIWD